MALSPDFAKDRLVYLSYAEAGDGRAGTAVGRGRLADDGARLEDFRVLFRQEPKLSEGLHFGSRLVLDGKGHLYIALGENNQRSTAQDLGKLQGKVVRIRPTARCRRTIPSWARPARAPRSGPMATAIRRAWR